ncbi:hypothetical protein Bca52824_080199 [Brassica carinata]|uniref:Uncharacterized protein n=1 Tax=Brassica carinata TaxID=52824 RepID=A0A8X7Q1I7_BRACI|nr:hypothetical protein Bca52824_080199 [Brassica carinata]
MHQLEVHEIVNEDLLLKNDDDPIPPKPDGSNIGPEGEFADTSALVAVGIRNSIGILSGLFGVETHGGEGVERLGVVSTIEIWPGRRRGGGDGGHGI